MEVATDPAWQQVPHGLDVVRSPGSLVIRSRSPPTVKHRALILIGAFLLVPAALSTAGLLTGGARQQMADGTTQDASAAGVALLVAVAWLLPALMLPVGIWAEFRRSHVEVHGGTFTWAPGSAPRRRRHVDAADVQALGPADGLLRVGLVVRIGGRTHGLGFSDLDRAGQEWVRRTVATAVVSATRRGDGRMATGIPPGPAAPNPRLR